MANNNLHQAKRNKNDEFYTQYCDIEREMNAYVEYNPDVFRGKVILCPCDDPAWSNFTKYFAQNFSAFGLRKLICTSYAGGLHEETEYEKNSPQYNAELSKTHGKLFILEEDLTRDGIASFEDFKWTYLEGDGDFRSDEVKALRDEADFIITNPPFSLFREFLAWIMEGEKKFIVISNMNAIGNKEVFPLIKENGIWLGRGFKSNVGYFASVYEDVAKAGQHIEGFIRVSNVCWLTNIDHGKRHTPLVLMTMEENLRHSKHKEIITDGYLTYDNYDAIEVPYTDAIPSDYEGEMGVPITFLDKYCPEQFEILGCTQRGCHDEVPDTKKYDDYWEVRQDGTRTGSSGNKTNENANLAMNDGVHNYFINSSGHVVQSKYFRIFIKKLTN